MRMMIMTFFFAGSGRGITVLAATTVFLFLGVNIIADAFLAPTSIVEQHHENKKQILQVVVDKAIGVVPEDDDLILSRREALTKATTLSSILTTAAALVVASSPASAAVATTTQEPTRIELLVETDYLIGVLRYFDGDMRKVLGAIVRSPFTTVQIDPPTNDKDNKARDAILRALYSYEAPEDYVEQAKWLKIEEKDNSWLEFLTKKRYTVTLPKVVDEGGDHTIPTTISLSNLESGVAATILSYPVAYAIYQYENYREEKEAQAKKAKFAAKKAAAAAAAKNKKKDDAGATKKKAAKVIKGEPSATAAAKQEKGPKKVALKKEAIKAPPMAPPDKTKQTAKQIVETELVKQTQNAPAAAPNTAPPVRSTSVVEPQVNADAILLRSKDDDEARGTMDAYAEQYAAMLSAINQQNAKE